MHSKNAVIGSSYNSKYLVLFAMYTKTQFLFVLHVILFIVNKDKHSKIKLICVGLPLDSRILKIPDIFRGSHLGFNDMFVIICDALWLRKSLLHANSCAI